MRLPPWFGCSPLLASGRRANDAMVGAKPNVDNVNWTKGIHASAPERECDMRHHDATRLLPRRVFLEAVAHSQMMRSKRSARILKKAVREAR